MHKYVSALLVVLIDDTLYYPDFDDFLLAHALLSEKIGFGACAII